MNTSTLRLGTAVVALALALTACGGDSEGSDGDGQSTLKLGMVPGGNINSLAPIVAQEKGFFEDEGLEVEIIDMAGGPQMVTAVASGSVDVMNNSVVNGMLANAAGQDMVGLVPAFGTPAYTWIAQEDWPTPNIEAEYPEVMKDFEGAVIGVPVLASSIELMTRAMISAAGLDPDKDVKFVAIGAGAQAIGAFEAGQVDIYVATEPGPSTLLDDEHGAKAMLDLRAAGDAPDPFVGWTDIVFQADKSNVEQNAEKFEKFAAAITAANEFIKSDKEGAVDVYATSLDMDEEMRSRIYDNNVDSIVTTVDCSGFTKMTDFFIGAGVLQEADAKDCSTFMWEGSSNFLTNQ